MENNKQNRLKQYLAIQIGFGLLLGAIQFLELGLNLQFFLDVPSSLLLCVVGLLLSAFLSFVLGIVFAPLVWFGSQETVGTTISRGWFLAGWSHLGLLLLPFAWMKWTQSQQSLALMVLAVWVLFGVLLYTNGRFWVVRLLREHGHLKRLYGFFAVITLIGSGIGVATFQGRGYGGSNAILSDPDVLVISLDGIGVNALSRYTSTALASTPNIDSLASQCMDFSDAVSVSSEVFPAHVAMFTGRYPGQLNIVGNDGLLKYASETVAERFVKEGYATALFGNAPELNLAQGFAQGIQLIDVDQPLDVFGVRVRGAANYRLGSWMQRYMESDVNPLEPFNNATQFFQNYQQKPVFAWLQSQIPDHLSPEAYRAQVESVDAVVGDFVRMLELRRVDRERLLIVTSGYGNHFEYGKSDHRGISEPVIRVPLIVCPLKSSEHQSSPFDGQVRSTDIPNTIYAQMGFSHNKEIPSVDISDRVKESIVYQTVLMGNDPEKEGGFQLGYRFQASNSTKMYKYKWYTHSKLHGVYNLETDPDEFENLIVDAETMGQELSQALTNAAKLIPALNVTHTDAVYFQPIP